MSSRIHKRLEKLSVALVDELQGVDDAYLAAFIADVDDIRDRLRAERSRRAKGGSHHPLYPVGGFSIKELLEGEKLSVYSVTLPMSGAAVFEVSAPASLVEAEVIDIAVDRASEAALEVRDGGTLCEIQDWEFHTEPVNVGNVCHFAHTTPTVDRKE
jgi:hypothetical protein